MLPNRPSKSISVPDFGNIVFFFGSLIWKCCQLQIFKNSSYYTFILNDKITSNGFFPLAFLPFFAILVILISLRFLSGKFLLLFKFLTLLTKIVKWVTHDTTCNLL